MADASNGGVIYYFCHIHSKMSGKIIIKQAGGAAYTNAKAEKALYPTTTLTDFDKACGTAEVGLYGDGASKCPERYVCGAIDTNFEKCLQAIDCKMNREMKSATNSAHSTHPMALFAQQMIPHHINAVNMAKILLQNEAAANIENAMEESGLVDILWGAARTIFHDAHKKIL